MVKQTKDNLKKAFKDDLNVKGLSILGESEEEGTTSKSFSISKSSPSSNPDSHQSKKDELQLPAAFPGINHNLQDTKEQLSLFLSKVITNRSESIIDKSIERTEINLAKLKQLKRQINNIMDHKQISKNLH